MAPARPVMTTWQPADANRSAATRPSPCVEPVMSAVRPSRAGIVSAQGRHRRRGAWPLPDLAGLAVGQRQLGDTQPRARDPRREEILQALLVHGNHAI